MADIQSTQGLLNKIFDPTTNSLRISGSGDNLFIWPSAFEISTGTPAISVANGVPSWEMDAAAVEAVAAIFTLPIFWTVVHFDLFHGTRSAVASANVRHRLILKDLAAGDLITEAAAADQSANVATPAQNVIQRRDGHIGSFTANTDRAYALVYERTATDAGDTYTVDSSFFGVRLRRAV